MNLNIVYGSKEQWPEKILTNIYRHFGLLLAELLKHPSIAKDKYREITSFEGENYLDEALKKNQGVIMVSGHTGNWEYNMAALAERGYTVNVVVKKLKHIDNNYLFHQLRGAKGLKTIYKDKAMIHICRALKKNEICVFVIDQHSKVSEGFFVEHFGQLASTFSAPYILSKRFKCPVLQAFGYRDKDLLNHHLEIYPEVVPLTCDDSEEEVKLNLKEYLKSLEGFLLRHPEQWIWMHRRWRSASTKNQE